MATITKRNNGSILLRSYNGYDKSGKQLSFSRTIKVDPTLTKRQAEKFIQQQAALFDVEVKGGKLSQGGNMRLEEFAEDWFKTIAAMKYSTQTLRGFDSLRPRIYSQLGHKKLNKISHDDVQKFVYMLHTDKCNNSQGKEGKTLSTKTIKLHIGLLSSIFENAVSRGYVTHNPCHRIEFPKNDRQEVEVYSKDEVKQLLELFEQESIDNLKYTVFFRLALYTGCRRGEILGLEWSDFSFDDGLVTIKRASTWSKERGIYTTTPKTKTSLRPIKLPDNATAMLKNYKKWQDTYKAQLGDKWVETDRLFTQADGKPMDPASPSVYYKGFCKRTGMRYISPHKFRHLYASMLIASGLDVTVVQRCLGHTTPTTTLSIYTHAFQEVQAKAATAVAEAINF